MASRRWSRQKVRERAMCFIAGLGVLVPNGLMIARVLTARESLSPCVVVCVALLTSACVTWITWDARLQGVPRWWSYLPLGLVFGIGFVLPLYLVHRRRVVCGRGPAHRARRGPASSGGGQVWVWTGGASRSAPRSRRENGWS